MIEIAVNNLKYYKDQQVLVHCLDENWWVICRVQVNDDELIGLVAIETNALLTWVGEDTNDWAKIYEYSQEKAEELNLLPPKKSVKEDLVLWNKKMDIAMALKTGFKNEDEFKKAVEESFGNNVGGRVEVKNIRIEPCIFASKGMRIDEIIPLSWIKDFSIENYYIADIEPIDLME